MSRSPAGPDPVRLGTLLRQAHVRAAEALDTALDPLPISRRHFGVLLHLSRLGESTHKELLALTGQDKAGLVRTIDALVEAGLVIRQESATDRRVNRLTLTRKGKALARNALTRARATGSEMFSIFDANELTQLVDLLQRLVDSQGADAESG